MASTEDQTVLLVTTYWPECTLQQEDIARASRQDEVISKVMDLVKHGSSFPEEPALISTGKFVTP